MSIRYWGAYCPQCNVWLRKDDLTLIYYPSPELMRADLSTDLGRPGMRFYRPHLFEVTEFGGEGPTDRERKSAGENVCPMIFKGPDRGLEFRGMGFK